MLELDNFQKISDTYIHFSGIEPEVFIYLEEAKSLKNDGRNGKLRLIDQRNYTYIVNRKSADFNKVWWICGNYNNKVNKCNARAISVGNKITKLSGEHSHEPNSLT